LDRPKVLGIVNVTADSFSDGGRFLDPAQAIAHGLRLRDEGADFVDVGGESTRPGSVPVALEEELRRVIPVVEALAKEGVAVSVDTMKPEVMRCAIDAGCAVVNDVNAFRARFAHHDLAGHDQNFFTRYRQIFPRFNRGQRRTQPARSDNCDEHHVRIGHRRDLEQSTFAHENLWLVLQCATQDIDLGFVDETHRLRANLIRRRGQFFRIPVRRHADDLASTLRQASQADQERVSQ